MAAFRLLYRERTKRQSYSGFSDESIILGPLVAGCIRLHDLPSRIAHIDHLVDEVLAQINETKKM